MASVSWDLDPKLDFNVGEKISKSSTPLEVAERIADVARELAPVDTGNYKDGIYAEKTKAGARVLSSDYYSTFIEFGAPNWNIAPQYVFRRAAESLGLKFRSKKK